jgi:hypothetical protein
MDNPLHDVAGQIELQMVSKDSVLGHKLRWKKLSHTSHLQVPLQKFAAEHDLCVFLLESPDVTVQQAAVLVSELVDMKVHVRSVSHVQSSSPSKSAPGESAAHVEYPPLARVSISSYLCLPEREKCSLQGHVMEGQSGTGLLARHDKEGPQLVGVLVATRPDERVTPTVVVLAVQVRRLLSLALLPEGQVPRADVRQFSFAQVSDGIKAVVSECRVTVLARTASLYQLQKGTVRVSLLVHIQSLWRVPSLDDLFEMPHIVAVRQRLGDVDFVAPPVAAAAAAAVPVGSKRGRGGSDADEDARKRPTVLGLPLMPSSPVPSSPPARK